MFLYGGSTIVILLQKGIVDIPESYFDATSQDIETKVTCGSEIGKLLK